MEPLACHIHTHIHTFLSFFPTDMGCFAREAFTKALGSSQKPFVRGAFSRKAFSRKAFSRKAFSRKAFTCFDHCDPINGVVPLTTALAPQRCSRHCLDIV